jgi:hypothetical protein
VLHDFQWRPVWFGWGQKRKAQSPGVRPYLRLSLMLAMSYRLAGRLLMPQLLACSATSIHKFKKYYLLCELKH